MFFTLNLDLVHVTPAPIFARLERLDDGVLGAVKMFGGVTVGRAVATSDVAAREAEAQVDPSSADLQAIFTALGGRDDLLDLFQMFTCHSGR